MTYSQASLRIALGFIFTVATPACGTEDPAATADMGTGNVDSGTADAGTADSGAFDSGSLDSGGADLGVEIDASTSTDGGETETLVAMSCEGLTPITTIHSSMAGGFVPQNIAVSVGDIVKFVNDDSEIQHTVWSTGFNPYLEPGENFCLQFTVPADYDYYCYFHSSMTGSILVTE